MRQVIQSLRDGTIEVPEVPVPELRAGGVLIRTVCSALSPGTERARSHLAGESLLGKARRRPDLVRQVIASTRQEGLRATLRKVRERLDAPKAPGYSSSGVVVAVAGDVRDLQVGDHVACAGEGHASHAEYAFVPRNLVARVPDGVRPDEAALTTLGAIALHGVRQSECAIGETVVIIGLGLVGQIAWQILQAAGVQAVGIDISGEAVEHARQAGLAHAYRRSEPCEEIVSALTDGRGADAVLITAATTSDDPVRLAGALARDRGRLVILGAVRADLPRTPFYEKELEVRMSRSYGPGRYDPAFEERGQDYPAAYVRWTQRDNLDAFLRLVAARKVDLSTLIAARMPVVDAPEAYALLTSGGAGAGSILLDFGEPGSSGADWPDALAPPPRATRVELIRKKVDGGRLGVAFIGAGRFATATLLPAVSADASAHLTGVATGHAHTARHVAERHGFRFAASTAADIVGDRETAVVFIATRHDSHSDLAREALLAGKAVFVEKPLSLDLAGMNAVLEAQAVTGAPLCVGFNRRFSPGVAGLLEALPEGTRRAVQIRVNAGPLPADHWLLDPLVGGGRLVGEGCHFIDLACFLAGSHPVSAGGMEQDGDFTAWLRFADGSLASVLYTGRGDASAGKERIEVCSGGTTACLEDHRLLRVHRDGKSRTRRFPAGKGHREMVGAFLAHVRGEGDWPVPLADIVASHRALFEIASRHGD